MISQVKPYFRTSLNALGYKEWYDGFNFSNVPQTNSDTLYGVELRKCSRIKQPQDNLEVKCPVTVHMYLPPSRDPKSLIDQATGVADTVINDLISSANGSIFGNTLKNVDFISLLIDKIDNSNDNGLLIEMDFEALVIFSTR